MFRHFVSTAVLGTVAALTCALPAGGTVSDSSREADQPVATLDSLVVRSSREQFLLQTPQSLVIVSSEEWTGTCKTIADVLAEHTGIQTRRFGGLGSFQTISVRGVEGSEVLVLLDGIPLNPAMGGAVDLGKINPSRLRAIEVYKGFVPARYGGNSLGGVIDLKSVAAPHGSVADIAAALAAYGTQECQVLLSHAPAPRLHLFGMLTAMHSENNFLYLDRNNTPYNPDDDQYRRLRNAATYQTSLLVHPRVELSDSRTLVSQVSGSLCRTELPAFEGKTNYTAYYEETALSVHVRLLDNRVGNRWWAEPAVGYTYTEGLRFATSLDEGVGASHSTMTVPNSYTEIGAVEQTLAIPLTGRLRLGNYLTVEPTLQILAADINPTVNTTGGTHGDWHSREFSVNAAMDVAYCIGVLRMALGGSGRSVYSQTDGGLDGTSMRVVAPSDTLTWLWAAHGGISMALCDERLTLYGNAGQFTNQPSLRERYGARGAHNPNPTLVPEIGIACEVGAKIGLQRLFGEIAGFYVRSYDKIITIFDGYQSGAINCDGARAYGIEGRAVWDPLRWLSLDTRATVQHTENLAQQYNWEGTPLPNEPAVDLFEAISLGPFAGLSLRYGLHLRSPYYLAPGAKQRVPSETSDGTFPWETRHQLSLDWKARKYWRVVLSANNVTNELLTRGQRAYPGEANYWWILVPQNQWKLEITYSF